ncbi:hypothetical protein RND15_39095 [Streptomyces sp. DSM 41529]|uniref:Uncharacterized protein n=1 Tax=Streptomyces lonegramiae TaxID=3075524 RepID=A0ABU2XRW4_9ACTN|nr:hypothetical protein [Streptomyces sp. DSM 41529]MDT0548649.1 hypothetical protein [Streptomyces sp. DSM 41529]
MTRQFLKPAGRGPFAAPSCCQAAPNTFLPRPFEQGVIDRDLQWCTVREKACHDQTCQGEADLVGRPAGGGEQAVTPGVVPRPLQPRAQQHPAHRVAARLRDQPGQQNRTCGTSER